MEVIIELLAYIGAVTVFVGFITTVLWVIDKINDCVFYHRCKRVTKTIQALINETDEHVVPDDKLVILSFDYEPETATYISSVSTQEFDLRVTLPARMGKARASLHFHNKKKNERLAQFIFKLLTKDTPDNHPGFDMLHDFKLLSALAYKRLK